MSNFTVQRDIAVAWIKANPHIVYPIVAFIVGFIVGKAA
jgi:hypothetical protein